MKDLGNDIIGKNITFTCESCFMADPKMIDFPATLPAQFNRRKEFRWGNRCSARVTSAPSCGLRHLMLTSAPSLIEMLTSAPCKRITCAEVNDLPNLICAEVNKNFQNLCRSSPVPKFAYPVSIYLAINFYLTAV